MKSEKRKKEENFFPARKKQLFGCLLKTVCKKGRMARVYRASMTLECACVLPWFLFAMLAILQFAKIDLVSCRVLGGMQDTVKEMAAYAYLKQLGVTAEDGVSGDLIVNGLSALYAKSSVEKKANFKDSDGHLYLWQSSFRADDVIDLTIGYYAKNTYTLLPIPKVKTILRTRVRAWTGRDGNGSTENSQGTGEETQGEIVYVTETGQVYHRDENCTHIRLSIQTVSRQEASHMRNESGGRYHACERCHGGGQDTVYITNYGDRYHSSLGCSGLRRTVTSVPVSELEGWRACSRCGG